MYPSSNYKQSQKSCALEFLGPRPCILGFSTSKCLPRRTPCYGFLSSNLHCLDRLIIWINPFQLVSVWIAATFGSAPSRVWIAVRCGSTPYIFGCVDRQILWNNRLFFRVDPSFVWLVELLYALMPLVILLSYHSRKQPWFQLRYPECSESECPRNRSLLLTHLMSANNVTLIVYSLLVCHSSRISISKHHVSLGPPQCPIESSKFLFVTFGDICEDTCRCSKRSLDNSWDVGRHPTRCIIF